MSVYKVPQDVEADDKLIGPFNFRQFIYLMVASGLVFVAFFLFQIFPGLILIPAPFIIFLGALALPLRKDQPMEVFLAAVISFHLKPQKRLWQPDGIEHLIEIYQPKTEEKNLTKDIAREEASRRLSYLADVVDTGGWAIKNAVSAESHVHENIFLESQGMSDIYENSAKRIDNLLNQQDNIRKRNIMENMNTARNIADFTDKNADQIQQEIYKAPSAVELYTQAQERAKLQQQNHLSWTSSQPQNLQSTQKLPQLQYNPYPENIHQNVILPASQQNQPPMGSVANYKTDLNNNYNSQYQYSQPQTSSTNQISQPSPEIMKLVSEGEGLSVETLARQANRIQQKAEKEINFKEDEEVIISLR